MGEWYRPPEFVVQRRPPQWVQEFVPNSQEKQLLAVAQVDLQTYAGFLRQPETGSFRLLPFYPSGRVVSANNPAIGWRRGFSAFASTYSFTKKKHGHGVNGKGDAYFGWSDLRLKDGAFSSGIMDQSLGLMVQIGDVALDEVTSETAGVSELTQFVPPGDLAAAAASFEKNLRGYQINGFRYASKLPAVVNTTYVLRSLLNKRADQLIAFRVVRQDADGLTIIWKKLRDYPKPAWR